MPVPNKCHQQAILNRHCPSLRIKVAVFLYLWICVSQFSGGLAWNTVAAYRHHKTRFCSFYESSGSAALRNENMPVPTNQPESDRLPVGLPWLSRLQPGAPTKGFRTLKNAREHSEGLRLWLLASHAKH